MTSAIPADYEASLQFEGNPNSRRPTPMKGKLLALTLCALAVLCIATAAHAFRLETIRGTAGDDVLRGGGGPDLIYGLGGNDSIWGGRGADRELGGTGDDVLHALAYDHRVDVLDCGPGDDTAYLNGVDAVRDRTIGCEHVVPVKTTDPDADATG
jgi:hypothetical protein